MSTNPLSGSGVYIIYCHANGKAYIGSSNKVNRRLANHRHHLRGGTHGNQHLQNAWNLYGESEFSVGLVHSCNLENRLMWEQFYIDVWMPSGLVFNRQPRAESPEGVRWTEEEKLAASIRVKANPPFMGRRHSDETKKLLSNQAKERYADPVNNPFYGKSHTDGTKAKISAANAGNKYCVGRVASDRCKQIVAAINRSRVYTDESKEKNRLASTGRLQSEETKARRAETLAYLPPVTDEQKARRSAAISAALKAKPPKTQAEKEVIYAKREATRVARLATMTTEQLELARKARSDKMVAACAKRSVEEKALIAKKKRETWLRNNGA